MMEWDRRHSAFLYHLLSGGAPVQRDKLHYDALLGANNTPRSKHPITSSSTSSSTLQRKRAASKTTNGTDNNGGQDGGEESVVETATNIIEQQLPPPSQMAKREHQLKKDIKQLAQVLSSASPSSSSSSSTFPSSLSLSSSSTLSSSSLERRREAKLLFIKLCWEVIAWSNEGWVWVALSPFFLLVSFFYLGATTIAKVKYLYIMLLIDIIVTGSIKYTTKRARPSYNKGGLFVGPDIFSFPSGHSSRAMMLAHVCIFVFGWQSAWSSAAVVTWAALVAISRLALGRHFLTDVMGGLALGALEFWATFLLLQRFAPPLVLG